MSYFDYYFKFPVVQIDSDYEYTKEERNKNMGTSDVEFDPEFVICDTEITSNDEVLFLTAAWFPNETGFSYARDDSKFPCTRVTFDISGQFLIPWSKEKFKKKWTEFKENVPKQNTIELTKENLIDFLKDYEDADIKE